MEKLNLTFKKPLAFIKIQTTGLNSQTDRIIELSITRVNLDGTSKTGTRLVNPEMEIPAEITKINGITNEMVKVKPTFKEIAENLMTFLEGCDFVGFNIAYFDLRFLSEEFNRAGVEFTLLGREVVDIAAVYHGMEPRDLTAAYMFYCGKKNEANSNSEKVTGMYFEILNNMLDKYKGQQVVNKITGISHTIESTVESINTIFNKTRKNLDIEGKIILNENGIPVFTFGKYGPSKDGKTPGKPVGESLNNDNSYYEWLINLADLPTDTKVVMTKILKKYKAKLATSTAS